MTFILRAAQPTQQKQRGAYYTPAPIACHILRLTLDPLLEHTRRPRVLDPACGDGVFLLEAANLLAEAGSIDLHAADPQACQRRAELVEQCLHGVDINQQAVADARQRLTQWILGDLITSPLHKQENNLESRSPSLAQRASEAVSNIVWGNSLLEANQSQTTALPSPAPPVDLGTFDAVVGNPPYINIRLASQTLDPLLRAYYSNRYRTARGAYDQYVLFLERACELLHTGGRYGWIIPNKLAGAGYAKACREMLTQQTTLDHWQDLSAVRVFAEAGVYPHIIAGCNGQPEASQHIAIEKWTEEGTPALTNIPTTIAATSLDKHGWTFGNTLAVESRVDTIALGDLASLHSGATGFQAQQLAAELCEAEELADQDQAFRFITSGNIDRFQIDDCNVRFMKRRFTRACLPHETAMLSEKKQQLYASPKIVIAGMTKRLEAAFDRTGRALGVQVYAAVDYACDPYYLLGLLNSRLLSHLFRQRFAAKQLAGGYLSINKAQLVQLPIAKPSAAKLPEQIAATARQLEQVVQSGLQRLAARRLQLEQELDRFVYQLYELTADEMAQVDHAFAKAA